MATPVIANIEDIARAGLTDLNRIVGALRRDPAEQLDRRPQPRLDDLPDLVAGARAAGLPVDLDASDLPPSLPASVELAAFRVVQESLTNALRYAQAPTRVRLACINGGLDVMVENDAPAVVLAAAAAPAGPSALVTHGGQTIAYRQSLPGSGGRGLAGLTERTQILGGTLDAGPQPDGGFEVHAWLPVRP